jgi:hypothetical protein
VKNKYLVDKQLNCSLAHLALIRKRSVGSPYELRVKRYAIVKGERETRSGGIGGIRLSDTSKSVDSGS